MKQKVEAVIKDQIFPTSGELRMGEDIKQINNLTKGEAIIVTDVGQHQMVASPYAKLINVSEFAPFR